MPVDEHGGQRGDGQLSEELGPGGDTAGVAVEFRQIVDHPHRRQPHGDHKRRLQVTVIQLAEGQHPGDQSGDDEQPAHGRRGLLGPVEQAYPGGVALDRLAEADAEPADQSWSQEQGQRETGHRRERGAKGDLLQRGQITRDGSAGPRHGQAIQQPEKHEK